jgi:hypothetical protein
LNNFMRGGAWAFEPTTAFAAPYTWLLVAMVAITIGRAGLLSWRLFGGVPRQRIPLDRVLDGSVSADDLARAALANLVSHDALSQERLARLRAGPRVEVDAALRTLRAADRRLDYLWRHLADGESSTWSLMWLTLIAAAFVTAYGFFPNWQYFVTDSGSNAFPANLQALYDAGEWVLARLALGLAVAGGLCVVAMVFDGLLQRRLASWKYVYATAGDALSGQPVE